MIKKFPQVLTNTEIDEAREIILKSNFNKELDTRFYYNSLGSHIAYLDNFVPKIEMLVKSVFDRPIKYSNSFCRLYHDQSYLGIHTDRQGLDVTVSLCIAKESEMDWPLCVSHKPWEGRWRDCEDMTEYKKDYTAVNLNPGEAGFCLGTIYPHWRDTLHCLPDQKNIYVFYHWSFA